MNFRLSTGPFVLSASSGTSVKWDEQGLETVREQRRKNVKCLEIRLRLLKRQRDALPEKAGGPRKADVAHR